MIDAREFNFYSPRISGLPRKCMDYSPLRYLRLMLPLPFFAWYVAGEALHRLETQWLRGHAGTPLSLGEACRAGGDATCIAYGRALLAHELAFVLLIGLGVVIALMATLPTWPLAWQKKILRRADWCLGAGLGFTWVAAVGSGVAVTLVAWLVPTVWWGSPGIGMQLALTFALFVFVRAPTHARRAWRLARGFHRRRTGREVARNESQALWQLIDGECRTLGVAAPSHLVLGVFPDCRLVEGRLTLDPSERRIDGTVLYLGATLATSLTEQQLRLLVRHAMLRRRGRFGAWLPAAEDWLESKEALLREYKLRRELREADGAADAALALCDEWLTSLQRMLPPLRAEHAFQQKADMQQQVEREAQQAHTILADAALAYRKDVFHLVVVYLGSGVECPPVFDWFAAAFAKRHGQVPKYASCYTGPALNNELVLLEKEWLIKTAQAGTPTDCWELRAA